MKGVERKNLIMAKQQWNEESFDLTWNVIAPGYQRRFPHSPLGKHLVVPWQLLSAAKAGRLYVLLFFFLNPAGETKYVWVDDLHIWLTTERESLQHLHTPSEVSDYRSGLLKWSFITPSYINNRPCVSFFLDRPSSFSVYKMCAALLRLLRFFALIRILIIAARYIIYSTKKQQAGTWWRNASEK